MSSELPWISDSDAACFQRFVDATALFTPTDRNSEELWLTETTLQAAKELGLEASASEFWRCVEGDIYGLVGTPFGKLYRLIVDGGQDISRSSAAAKLVAWSEKLRAESAASSSMDSA